MIVVHQILMRMSSFSNNHLILLLHLALLLIPSPQFTSGYTLIELECFNSETPQTCLNCVNSDPAAGKADRIGIATIVVNCISSQAQTLLANMTRLALHEKDEELKKVYLNCSKQYFNAKGILDDSAKQALKNHEYDNAERFVVKALSFDYECYDSTVGKVPGDVSKEMKKYEELSEAACRIIERLT